MLPILAVFRSYPDFSGLMVSLSGAETGSCLENSWAMPVQGNRNNPAHTTAMNLNPFITLFLRRIKKSQDPHFKNSKHQSHFVFDLVSVSTCSLNILLTIEDGCLSKYA